MTNAHVETTNWEKLKAALKQETANMERAAGEKIVDVNLLSDNELTLINRKTRSAFRLAFSDSMDALRVENSAGIVNFTKIPDLVGSLTVDLSQALS